MNDFQLGSIFGVVIAFLIIYLNRIITWALRKLEGEQEGGE